LKTGLGGAVMNAMFLRKVAGVVKRKADATLGRLWPIEPTLEAMALRPYELHLELTNLCNANCIFCPYQFQTRPTETMRDEVFEKAVADYVAEGGGSVQLTPIVGDALIDPRFLERVRRLSARPEIDRIQLTTNAILVDRFGAEAIVASGLTTITISIAGFDQAMYERVYRSKQYPRVHRNVLALLAANKRAGNPVNIVIGLRPDRPLDEVARQPDFKEVLAYRPELDFTWSFTSAGGRITREMLPPEMRLRARVAKRESCVQTYNGPMVLADGTVMACSCVAALDAARDLGIGNVMERPLGEIWRSEHMRKLRASFGTEHLNPTCASCDMYRDLELYRTREGRSRSRINRARAQGELVHRPREHGIWTGG
jgi:radical SAM protein with 4Fe4S-binding SPASM domain